MSSRFPTTSTFDYCYSPVRISKNGRVLYVPCGKCNGCFLHKANEWSFRLGDAIENASASSIFFTPTYNNHYVPKLQAIVEAGSFHWISAPGNVRYNGHFDVPREFVSFYSKDFVYAPLKNYHDPKVVGYVCKSDIQLYLKLLRKNIYEQFNISTGSFIYYIVAEYGPGKSPYHGKFRPHYHGVIIPCNSEVSDFLLDSALYENWKMCDNDIFQNYTKCCDSGARHYVTEYVTGITYLPSFYRKNDETKPFALASKKAGSLGVCHFDRKEVCKDIERGVDSYTKRISRLERNYIFLYPSTLTSSLFPKCSRFSLLSFNGLLRVYEYLYNIRRFGCSFSSLFDKFCEFSAENFGQQDYVASFACLKVCDMMDWTPYHYVDVLVGFYYRKAMRALRYQYELQEKMISDPYKCIGFYNNWESFVFDKSDPNLYSISSLGHLENVRQFLSSFGLSTLDKNKVYQSVDNCQYVLEVDQIIHDADKSKKVNALVGDSPHIV